VGGRKTTMISPWSLFCGLDVMCALMRVGVKVITLKAISALHEKTFGKLRKSAKFLLTGSAVYQRKKLQNH
jgi:cytochrome bd-type quinol oxidase subunit 2